MYYVCLVEKMLPRVKGKTYKAFSSNNNKKVLLNHKSQDEGKLREEEGRRKEAETSELGRWREDCISEVGKWSKQLEGIRKTSWK